MTVNVFPFNVHLAFKVCMVIESLADGAVRLGMTRDMAHQLAVQTVLGTAMLVRDSGIHPAQLRVGFSIRNICSRLV